MRNSYFFSSKVKLTTYLSVNIRTVLTEERCKYFFFVLLLRVLVLSSLLQFSALSSQLSFPIGQKKKYGLNAAED